MLLTCEKPAAALDSGSEERPRSLPHSRGSGAAARGEAEGAGRRRSRREATRPSPGAAACRRGRSAAEREPVCFLSAPIKLAG